MPLSLSEVELLAGPIPAPRQRADLDYAPPLAGLPRREMPMTEEPPKPEIDYRDCNYSIDIGAAVKRSLIRHFIRFLDAKIAERGFDPHDERPPRRIVNA